MLYEEDAVVGAGLIASALLSTLAPMPSAFEAIDGLWIALSVFFVLVALGLTYLLVRLGGTVGQLTSFLEGLEREVLPVINEAGGTMQRVNAQLDKADRVTDSAVDVADSVDTAVRAVTIAITRPVQKIAGLAEGLAHASSSLRVAQDPRRAYETGREAAAPREEEIEEELRGGGESTDRRRSRSRSRTRRPTTASRGSSSAGLAARLDSRYESSKTSSSRSRACSSEGYAPATRSPSSVDVEDDALAHGRRPARRGAARGRSRRGDGDDRLPLGACSTLVEDGSRSRSATAETGSAWRSACSPERRGRR